MTTPDCMKLLARKFLSIVGESALITFPAASCNEIFAKSLSREMGKIRRWHILQDMRELAPLALAAFAL